MVLAIQSVVFYSESDAATAAVSSSCQVSFIIDSFEASPRPLSGCASRARSRGQSGTLKSFVEYFVMCYVRKCSRMASVNFFLIKKWNVASYIADGITEFM